MARNNNTEFLSKGEGSNGPPDVATLQLLAAPDRRVRKDAGISYCYCCDKELNAFPIFLCSDNLAKRE